MLERIENDPECRDIMNRLLSEANRLMYTPAEQIIPIQGNNTRSGWSEYDNDGKFGNYFYSIIPATKYVTFYVETYLWKKKDPPFNSPLIKGGCRRQGGSKST